MERSEERKRETMRCVFGVCLERKRERTRCIFGGRVLLFVLVGIPGSAGGRGILMVMMDDCKVKR